MIVLNKENSERIEGGDTVNDSAQATRRLFPFCAIVGQEEMKLALLLHAVCPEIGGVLIRGQKGTAKSTAVRALSELLPKVRFADGREAVAPFVDLPLGATEDRVVGSIDLEAALRLGKPQLQPGLLARADKGILYVDEVNLLDDHLVDSVLDVAESGVNLIEREGLSAWHESRFVLVGTMNPEEGDLRPQLLDRFGLAVEVQGELDLQARKRLLLEREAFDADPVSFRKEREAETIALRNKILDARKRLAETVVPKHLLGFIAEICSRHHVAGHRADITIQRAATALAAWQGRTEVLAEDISKVSPMALLHRMRNSEPPEMPPPPPEPPQNENESEEDPSPNEEPQSEESEPQETSGQESNEAPLSPPQGSEDDEEQDSQEEEEESETQNETTQSGANQEMIQPAGEPFKVKRFEQDDLRNLRSGSGRRNRTRSATRQGRYIKSSFRLKNNDLAIDATLRAAAPYQKARKEKSDTEMAVIIDGADKRGRIREKRIGSFLLFAVDASGSMGAQKRMSETKSAILSLLLDAYQKRDKVAMIAFRGRESSVILPPTSSIELAAKLLEELPVGGRTPLTAALVDIEKTLEKALRKEPSLMPMVLLLTDGRANAGLGTQHRPHEEALLMAARLADRFEQTRFVVVDTEPPGVVRLGLAGKVAQAMRAEHFQTNELRAEDLVAISQT